MTHDNRDRPDLDRLLGQAFPDDLPVEVEVKMSGRIERFRQKWAERDRDIAGVSIRFRRWTSAIAGASLAAVSILFVILGFRLLSAGPQADLGSSLASLQWAAFSSERIMESQSMECAVRLDKPGEPSKLFIIQWISPEETRVRLVQAGEEIVRTVHPAKAEKSVLELISKPSPDQTAALPELEAELVPVEGLLSSARLSQWLDGRWQAAGTERRNGCDWKYFSVTNAPGPEGSPSKITVDTCTSLPVRLEKEVGPGERIEALFRWVPPAERRGLFSPGQASRPAAETTPS